MAKRVFWCVLGDDDRMRQFVQSAMRELAEALAGPLGGIKVFDERLPEKLWSGMESALAVGDFEGAIRAIEGWGDRGRIGVSVFCLPTHPAARAAQKRVVHARWGLSFRGRLSLTYVMGNKYALWHETLHLFGAQDHYDLKTFRTTCELPSCVMQYAPTEEVLEGRGYLCAQTLEILRRLGVGKGL
jgi:hypothetical protein